jgi:glycosyltransferase involved in cell wall biosynthesis
VLCHKVICITKDNYNRAVHIAGSKRVAFIHNGIAEGMYKSKEEAGAEMKIENGPTVIGGIGELTWNKGWHYLLRAVGILKRKALLCRVVIIGGGEERVFLETVAKEEDIAEQVTFLGFIPDAAQYMKLFDIFVLPSVKEGLPYVLLEAGQAGLPVVASNVGGIPDIIGNTINGLTFKTKSAEDLADKLEAMLKDEAKRKQFAEALKERTDSEFSLQNMVNATKALY